MDLSENSVQTDNEFEALLFHAAPTGLKGNAPELFGINVFKIREVFESVDITSVPGSPPEVRGMISLRGEILPVIDLSDLLYGRKYPEAPLMMVTEFAGHKQVFLIHAILRIQKMSWKDIQPIAMGQENSLVSGVAQLSDNVLVSLLDVEQVLSRFIDFDAMSGPAFDGHSFTGTALFVDDSLVARKQIEKTIKALGLTPLSAADGLQGWNTLDRLAKEHGSNLKQHLRFILTDVEMPEMDGYEFTQRIKKDSRFAGIPVVMYSSLTQGLNEAKGRKAGADVYVEKFNAAQLASTLAQVMTPS